MNPFLIRDVKNLYSYTSRRLNSHISRAKGGNKHKSGNSEPREKKDEAEWQVNLLFQLTPIKALPTSFPIQRASSRNWIYLWEADNLKDYLVNVSLSLETKVTDASELQAEFFDDFKNKPSDFAYKKIDIALILKYVVGF